MLQLHNRKDQSSLMRLRGFFRVALAILAFITLSLVFPKFALAQAVESEKVGKDKPCYYMVDRNHKDGVLILQNPYCDLRNVAYAFPLIDLATGKPYPMQAQLRSIYEANKDREVDGKKQRHTVMRSCVMPGKPDQFEDQEEKEYCPKGLVNYFGAPATDSLARIVVPRTHIPSTIEKLQAELQSAKDEIAQLKSNSATSAPVVSTELQTKLADQSNQLKAKDAKIAELNAKLAAPIIQPANTGRITELEKAVAGKDVQIAELKRQPNGQDKTANKNFLALPYAFGLSVFAVGVLAFILSRTRKALAKSYVANRGFNSDHQKILSSALAEAEIKATNRIHEMQKSCDARVKQLKSANEQAVMQMSNQYEQTLQDLREQKDQADKALENERADNAQLNREIVQLRADVEAAQERIHELQTQIEVAEAKLSIAIPDPDTSNSEVAMDERALPLVQTGIVEQEQMASGLVPVDGSPGSSEQIKRVFGDSDHPTDEEIAQEKLATDQIERMASNFVASDSLSAINQSQLSSEFKEKVLQDLATHCLHRKALATRVEVREKLINQIQCLVERFENLARRMDDDSKEILLDQARILSEKVNDMEAGFCDVREHLSKIDQEAQRNGYSNFTLVECLDSESVLGQDPDPLEELAMTAENLIKYFEGQFQSIPPQSVEATQKEADPGSGINRMNLSSLTSLLSDMGREQLSESVFCHACEIKSRLSRGEILEVTLTNEDDLNALMGLMQISVVQDDMYRPRMWEGREIELGDLAQLVAKKSKKNVTLRPFPASVTCPEPTKG